MAKHPKHDHNQEAALEQQEEEQLDNQGVSQDTNGTGSSLTITIQGIHFSASAPYIEGHPLTALEANALNNLRGENLRNNFSSHVKKAFEAKIDAEKKAGYSEELLSKEFSAEEVEALRTKFAEYETNYSFTLRGTRTPVDPVEAEAQKIARAIVRGALTKNKIDTKTLPEGKIDELVEGLLTKQPGIREEARKRVEATKALASASMGLDISSLQSPNPPQAAEATE